MKNPGYLHFLSFILLVVFSASSYALSPYAGQENRDIKALSADEIDGYLNGRGMGFAKAAELNSYPGPRHVLDLAGELALTDKQTKQTQALFHDMQSQAIVLGRQLVEKEQLLDGLFAARSIDDPQLKQVLLDIGELQGELRYVHLRTHLAQTALLTQHQIHLYNQLRGYNGGQSPHQHRH